MSGTEKIYYIAKKYKKGVYKKMRGEYNKIEDAIDNTPKAYSVFDEEGNKLYTNERSRLQIWIFILIILLSAAGIFTVTYNYLIRDRKIIEVYDWYVMPDESKVRYDKNSVIDLDQDGNVKVKNETVVETKSCGEKTISKGSVVKSDGTLIIPENKSVIISVDIYGNIRVSGGSARIIYKDCKEVTVSDGTIITPSEVIVNPDGKNPPSVKEPNGDIILEDDNKIITPCKVIDGKKGTIVRTSGIVVIPDNNTKLTIDKNSYIIVNGPKATVITKDCKEITIGDKSIILPDDTIVDPKGTTPIIDNKGNVITEGDSLVISKCGERTIPKGSIVQKSGIIIIPTTSSAKLTIDANGHITVIGGTAKVIYPNCTEKELKENWVLTPGGIIVEPTNPEKPIEDDGQGNTKIPEDNTNVITPVCGDINTLKDTTITKYGIIIMPDSSDTKITIDKSGNIVITGGSATVLYPDCRKVKVSNGTIITPAGVIVDPENKTAPKIDKETGKIITNDDTKVIEPNGCLVTVPKGSIVFQNGTIIVGANGISPTINSDKTITIPEGGKIIYPNCTEKIIKYGGTIDDNGKIKENDDPTKVFALSYQDGNGVNFTEMLPGKAIPTKTFSVKNTGNQDVTYNALWTKVINEFERTEDLVVTIKRNGTVIKDKIPLPVANNIMISGTTIPKNETHNYELIFEYIDTLTNQDIDKGKMFTTTIQIEA